MSATLSISIPERLWSPIEEAPKDGTLVFIRDSLGNVDLGEYRVEWNCELGTIDEPVEFSPVSIAIAGRATGLPRVMSGSDREFAFREAIEAVCREHGAELHVTDDGKSYGMQSGVLRVSFDSVWEGDECVKEFVEFEW